MPPTLAQAVAEALPLALAIAASPFTVIPAILLLFTARPRATASAFIAGWLLGLLVVLAASSALASRLDPDGPTPTWLSWARVALGLALLVWAWRQWTGRRSEKPTPAWMRSIEGMTPARGLGLGVVLSLANPKVLLLGAAAGLGIGSVGLPRSQVIVAVVVTALVASITVVAPLLLHLVLGERMVGPLTRVRDWLERNNAVVMTIVLAVLGVTVLLEGVTGLR